jgi:hypothetical protein
MKSFNGYLLSDRNSGREHAEDGSPYTAATKVSVTDGY